MPGQTTMTSRIPVDPKTLKRMRDLQQGMSAETYDEALNLVFDLIANGEDDLLVGYRLREELMKRRPADYKRREPKRKSPKSQS